jgi:hypothetical protein
LHKAEFATCAVQQALNESYNNVEWTYDWELNL